MKKGCSTVLMSTSAEHVPSSTAPRAGPAACCSTGETCAAAVAASAAALALLSAATSGSDIPAKSPAQQELLRSGSVNSPQTWSWLACQGSVLRDEQGRCSVRLSLLA